MRNNITEEQITNLLQAIPRAEQVDRLRAEIEKLRADNERLRAEIDGLEAELALMKSGFEIAYQAMGDKP
jgi:cell division protein FtsB